MPSPGDLQVGAEGTKHAVSDEGRELRPVGGGIHGRKSTALKNREASAILTSIWFVVQGGSENRASESGLAALGLLDLHARRW